MNQKCLLLTLVFLAIAFACSPARVSVLPKETEAVERTQAEDPSFENIQTFEYPFRIRFRHRPFKRSQGLLVEHCQKGDCVSLMEFRCRQTCEVSGRDEREYQLSQTDHEIVYTDFHYDFVGEGHVRFQVND